MLQSRAVAAAAVALAVVERGISRARRVAALGEVPRHPGHALVALLDRVLRRPGRPGADEPVRPEGRAGQVQIHTRAAGVNPADYKIRRGGVRRAPPDPLPAGVGLRRGRGGRAGLARVHRRVLAHYENPLHPARRRPRRRSDRGAAGGRGHRAALMTEVTLPTVPPHLRHTRLGRSHLDLLPSRPGSARTCQIRTVIRRRPAGAIGRIRDCWLRRGCPAVVVGSPALGGLAQGNSAEEGMSHVGAQHGDAEPS